MNLGHQAESESASKQSNETLGWVVAAHPGLQVGLVIKIEDEELVSIARLLHPIFHLLHPQAAQAGRRLNSPRCDSWGSHPSATLGYMVQTQLLNTLLPAMPTCIASVSKRCSMEGMDEREGMQPSVSVSQRMER